MNSLKKIIIYFFIVALISSCTPSVKEETYKDIDARESFELIQNERPLILDVRTPNEYAAGHIKDSILIPVQVLKTEYVNILEYKEKPIFIYCRSGNRSVAASKILLETGFKPIYNLKGGIKSWVQSGYPIEK